LRGIVYDVAGEWGAEQGRRTVQTTNQATDLLTEIRQMRPLSVLMSERVEERQWAAERTVPFD